MSNATSGFSTTEMILFNRNAIPDYAFLTSTNPNNDNALQTTATTQQDQPTEVSPGTASNRSKKTIN